MRHTVRSGTARARAAARPTTPPPMTATSTVINRGTSYAIGSSTPRRFRQWNSQAHMCAFSRRACESELATHAFHAFSHTDEAVVLRLFRLIERRIEPDAVVLNRHVKLSRIE